MDIFPREEERKDDDTDRSDHSKRGRVSSFLDTSIASADIKSRSTPEAKANVKGADTVTAAVNLRSTASAVNTAIITAASTTLSKDASDNTGSKTNVTCTSNATKEAAGDKITSLAEMVEEEAATSLKNTEEASSGQDIVVSLKESSVGEVARGKYSWQHAGAACLACARTRPPSSYQLREAFFAGMDTNTSSSTDRRSPSRSPTNNDRGLGSPEAELLRQVHLMANPIHLRQTRSVLLSLKQRHPEVFRSPCVYSDMCSLLARDTYMLCARRFLQELFLDTCFDCFAAEPAAILARHGAVLSPVAATPTDTRL